MFDPICSFSVSLLYDEDGFAVPRRDLLEGVHALGEDVVPHHDHQDGHRGVHQSQGAVLQFPSLDSLCKVENNADNVFLWREYRDLSACR